MVAKVRASQFTGWYWRIRAEHEHFDAPSVELRHDCIQIIRAAGCGPSPPFGTRFHIARSFSRFCSWHHPRFQTTCQFRFARRSAGGHSGIRGGRICSRNRRAQPLLELNAGVAMNPASVMKLVTTFAGLELLGPAYTWKTELYADGFRNGDTLQGNLIIKGYGDPKLNLENFWLLAAAAPDGPA